MTETAATARPRAQPMPPSRRWLLLVVWAAWTAVQAGRLAWAGMTVDPTRRIEFAPAAEIDINSARVGELALLPGIGPRRAADLVLHRVRHGPFRSVEDLGAVPGFGPGTVARLRDQVRVSR